MPFRVAGDYFESCKLRHRNEILGGLETRLCLDHRQQVHGWPGRNQDHRAVGFGQPLNQDGGRRI